MSITVYDREQLEHKIEAKKEKDHFVIEVDSKFYCSCDNWKEVNEEVPAIMEACNFSYFKEG